MNQSSKRAQFLAPLRIEESYKDDRGVSDSFAVEFEVLAPEPLWNCARTSEISKGLEEADRHIADIQDMLSSLNSEIDRLTNHCDALDYITAAFCGVIAGVIDSIYVGAWDFRAAKAKANADINKAIEEFAAKCGYEDKGDGLKGAVEFLEKKFPMPGDNAWKCIGSNISAASHHLDDYCHHPTLVGLICCIIVQFTGRITFHDKLGVKITRDVEVNIYGEFHGNSAISRIFCGVINWFINCAKAVANAKGHWMSDMAGSSQARNGGAGLPGSFMSLLKELAPFFNSKDAKGNPTNAFAESLRKAFQNGIGKGKTQMDLGVFNCLFDGASSKFDARTEQAVRNLLKKQTVPVMVNEALVRGTYFIRRLVQEVREKGGFAAVEWRKVLPFRNRTIARMLTIATGTFCACDMADATVRSGVRNGFNIHNPKFWSDTILRINFVGIGRFAFAVVTDVGMGMERTRRCGELIGANNNLLLWTDARMLYRQGEMWVAAENTARGIFDCYDAMEEYYSMLCKGLDEDRKSLDNMASLQRSASESGKARMALLADSLKYLC